MSQTSPAISGLPNTEYQVVWVVLIRRAKYLLTPRLSFSTIDDRESASRYHTMLLRIPFSDYVFHPVVSSSKNDLVVTVGAFAPEPPLENCRP